MMGPALANSEVTPAEGPRPTVGMRRVPSGPALALIVPAVLLYWQLGGPSPLLSDPNTGVHVRTGEWILAQHAVPRQDLFSFAFAGRAWCDWEWLSDALYAALYRWHGLAAIAAFGLALLCLTSLAVYLTARLHTSGMVAFTVTCLVMATTTIHWLARPHLFTWFLVGVFCWVIEKARVPGNRRLLLVLPILTLLWANLHPGFLAGVLILTVWSAAELAQACFRCSSDGRVARSRWSRWFGLTAFACLAATFVNPYGIQLHHHIVEYLYSPRTVTAQVAEWLSPDFHNPRLHWFELLLPVCAAAGLWHGIQGRLAWCALTFGWMHLALVSVRNVPLCAIVCAAPVASFVEHVLHQCELDSRFRAAEARLRYSRVGTFICCALAVGLVVAVGCKSALRLGPSSSLPVEAVAHLPPGRLFTTDRWADYVIYAESGRQVFFDCRNDLYGPGFVDDYLMLIRAQPGWQDVAAKYAFAVALVPSNAPIAAALAASADWRISYKDNTAAIFVRSES
jgi:hypothetical protein